MGGQRLVLYQPLWEVWKERNRQSFDNVKKEIIWLWRLLKELNVFTSSTYYSICRQQSDILDSLQIQNCKNGWSISKLIIISFVNTMKMTDAAHRVRVILFSFFLLCFDWGFWDIGRWSFKERQTLEVDWVRKQWWMVRLNGWMEKIRMIQCCIFGSDTRSTMISFSRNNMMKNTLQR